MKKIKKDSSNKKQGVYIFVVHTITPIGGMESYSAGMAKYLESCGWKVYMLSPESNDASTAIPSLEKYLKIGGGFSFLIQPPYKYARYEQEVMIFSMIQKLNLPPLEDCEIIVESCSWARACWAELLAEKLGARHFFIASEEKYREDWQCYDENLPFFYFKWQRNEMVGGNECISRLFNGYKNVKGPLIEFPPTVQEQDAIQDVDFPDLQDIPIHDFNICHIGRHGKDYVRPSILGVAEFARRHPDKNISFVLIGDAEPLREFLTDTFGELDNVSIALCGILVPIPRSLLMKMDVVIAVSQTARFAANEGVLTIAGSIEHAPGTPGVLGYDTDQQVHGPATFSYADVLDRIFIEHVYDNQSYSLPKLRPAEEAYQNIWTIIKRASSTPKEYYTQIGYSRIRDWTAIFPFGMVARGAKIILFGATDIAKDYRSQIDSQNNVQMEIGSDYIKQIKPQPYCQVIATVDENPEDFDDSVTGIERLQQRDYDAIVAAVSPQQFPQIYNQIAQIVPDMVARVVYNFQVTRM